MVDHPLYAATSDHFLARAAARGLAERRQRLLAGARGRVLEMGAGTGLDLDQADFADGTFDTIVSTLALCRVPDLDRAASQIRRWLARDGRLLFLEHVRGPSWRGWAQTAATPAWSLMAGGCHLNRDVLSALRRADLFVTDCERFSLPGGGPLLASCVQGIAQPAGS